MCEADGFLVGQPFLNVFVVGLTALGCVLASDEDQLYIVPLGNLGTFILALLNGSRPNPLYLRQIPGALSDD